MSNPDLPPEIVDWIIDLLHDEPDTLKACCLASKSWVRRTRKHLFATIEFYSAKTVESWKETFPDPSNSPAYYTHTLCFRRAPAVTAAGTGAGGFIQSFSRVTRLELNPQNGGTLVSFGIFESTSLAPFHNFSPLKSLCLGSAAPPYSQVFNLIRSFPLLEDLVLMGHDPGKDGDPNGLQTVIPSTSPALTGSLTLMIFGGMGGMAQRLLNLSGSLRFRKLGFLWGHTADPQWITELVTRCSDSLESLSVTRAPLREFVLILHRNYNLHAFVAGSGPTSFDLSKATKLRDVGFRGSLDVEWVAVALQTITPKHRDLRQISVTMSRAPTSVLAATGDIRPIIGETKSRQWSELDRILVQLWESHLIRLKVTCAAPKEKKEQDQMRGWMVYLFPETTKRGIIDLV